MSEAVLRVEQVSHAFEGVAALREVSLEVARGRRVALVGESGAGKSTLLRCLNLLVRPRTGRVWLDGRSLGELDAGELEFARRQVGMVFQHFALLARRTVRQNVALPLELAGVPQREIDPRVDELLTRVSLRDRADAWPSQLSGGQRQRVGIARALAHCPRVLLCDEPTSALDPPTARQVVDLLDELSGELDLTIVFVTHQLELVRRLADTVVVLEQGWVRETTPVADFFTEPRSRAGRRLLEPLVRSLWPLPLLQEARSRVGVGPVTLVDLRLGPGAAHGHTLEHLIRAHDVSVEVVGAQVEPTSGRPAGRLALLLRGTPQRVQAALDTLRASSTVEVVGHVPSAA